jgi:hypothetical protein
MAGGRQELNFEKLLKLRTVIARFGELDIARWWNSNGQLGRLGAVVLRRGFSRTHRFAQARSVFAIAAQKCDDFFNPPDCVTLWKLPEAIEEQFDAHWEKWLDQPGHWDTFFERIENLGTTNLVDLLQSLELVSDDDLVSYKRLRNPAGERAVLLPGVFGAVDADIRALALGFACGKPGSLVVPYLKKAAV